jgi:excinuclease ABC subunit B
MDNRPLKFDEFEAMQNQVIYVSATRRITNCKTDG